MAPETTCGAAMPVTMSNPISNPQAADQKTINFLAGHLRNLAIQRGRPGDIAEKFVKENLTLSYNEAFNHEVVDFIVDDLSGLLAVINGHEIETIQGKVRINTSNADVIALQMGTSKKVINIISNPTLAMILLMLGIYGLIIGFSSPGFLFPEILGSISLILGLYGIGLFEVNITAGLLILLGIILLVAEAFTPTYGLLGIGGMASIVLGIVFFTVEPLMPTSWLGNFRIMAVGVGLIGVGFLVLILTGIFKLKRAEVVHGDQEFNNAVGLVIKALTPYGQIKLRGEIWKAKSWNQEEIKEGTRVEVIAREGMLLIVKPLIMDEKINEEE